MGTAGEMCMERVNNVYSIVLEIVKVRGSIKRDQIIQTDTLNTFCETQAVFTIFTELIFLWDTLYILLCFFTKRSF